MTNILSVCFFAIFCVILTGVVSPLNGKHKGMLLAGAGIVFFLLFLGSFSPILETLSSLTEKTGHSSLFSLLWKALGISFLVSVCSSFCRDLGEDGVAEKLEVCGKGAILYLSLPVLNSLLNLMGEIMQ